MKQVKGGNVKRTLWIAIFAFLMHLLLPGVLYAAAPKSGHLSEVCTASGIKKIAADKSSNSGGDSGDTPPGQHCPMCPAIEPFAPPASDAVPDLPAPAGLRGALDSPDRPSFAHIRLRPFLRGPPIPA
jgi:hypothetical protein